MVLSQETYLFLFIILPMNEFIRKILLKSLYVYQPLWKHMDIKRRPFTNVDGHDSQSEVKFCQFYFGMTLDTAHLVVSSLKSLPPHRSELSTPQSRSLSFYSCPCSSRPTQGVRMFFLKSKSDYVRLLPQPFQFFPPLASRQKSFSAYFCPH